MGRAVVILAWGAAVAAFAGCGGKFKLPTESRLDRSIPSDKSYQMQATWAFSPGDTIRDILLTQGSGTQLFLLFGHAGAGTASRGHLSSYSRFKPTNFPPNPPPDPIPGVAFATLFNPIALCSGGDGAGAVNNRIFVLDAGDTALARAGSANGRVIHPELFWQVREFRLLGGDTATTFSDTTVAWVNGVAADAQGRVYVSGLAVVLVATNPSFPNSRERQFLWRIYRYERGLRYPGIDKGDLRLNGNKAWHRDTLWMVEDGNGTGSVLDPRGMFWSGAAGGGALYVADYRKNLVQKLDDQVSSTGFYRLDGNQSDLLFNGPLDVAVDLDGFIYIADSGNQRVLRYGPDEFDPLGGLATFVQRVDIAHDAFGDFLANPVTVAADDSLAYVGDATQNRVVRYKRRP